MPWPFFQGPKKCFIFVVLQADRVDRVLQVASAGAAAIRVALDIAIALAVALALAFAVAPALDIALALDIAAAAAPAASSPGRPSPTNP